MIRFASAIPGLKAGSPCPVPGQFLDDHLKEFRADPRVHIPLGSRIALYLCLVYGGFFAHL